jgi:Zn-dependent protease with chaperone function
LNFFDAQDNARRSTRRLLLVYWLATALIVLAVTMVVGTSLYFVQMSGERYEFIPFLGSRLPLLLGTAAATALFIVGASMFKTRMLSAGGGRVAQDLGGTLVPTNAQDPLHQRLRNVVEEMAIASGVAVPEIYILEQENGINAFAAGFRPEDAAIAVTRGTLELLDRDELQGVIAHEFSHILNGDMRINIRLMGTLFGIMVLGLIGRMVLRGGRYGAFVSRRERGVPVVLFIGIGLAILGAVGVFFARIIKANVSRQREFLADASAVQFTRQTTGLANALKKIGGYAPGSHIEVADPEEISHMLFGTGSRLSGLFATHPPLTERIQALEPTFKAGDYPDVDIRTRRIAAEVTTPEPRHASVSAFAGAISGMSGETVTESIGDPGEQHVEYAILLRQSIPTLLYDAAHSPELAYLLSIALVLDPSGGELGRQLSLAHELLGEQRAQLIEKYYDALDKCGAEYRLPLLEIAFPALRRRPPSELEFLVDLAKRMIDIDGEVDLYEFCFYRILVSSLRHALNPSFSPNRRRASRKTVRVAIVDLLRIVAQHGHETDDAGESAFRAGLKIFGRWGDTAVYDSDGEFSAAKLDAHLDLLTALNAKGRELVIKAISAVIVFDGKLTATEANLLHAICASLECPLPPIVAANRPS